MNIGDLLSFQEIYDFFESEKRAVFTQVLTPPMGSQYRFYLFYSPDKNVAAVTLKTDWKITRGTVLCVPDEIHRVCWIGTADDVTCAIVLAEDSPLWGDAYHWIAPWKTEKENNFTRKDLSKDEDRKDRRSEDE